MNPARVVTSSDLASKLARNPDVLLDHLHRGHALTLTTPPSFWLRSEAPVDAVT